MVLGSFSSSDHSTDSSAKSEKKAQLHVGICGAGLGGLAASIAVARAGAKVTLLEAAHALGEVGAGIQLTPNVSRHMIRWGITDIVGDGFVQPSVLRSMNGKGEVVQQTDLLKVGRDYGFPWYAVHRADLHAGLVEGALRHGVDMHVDSRVSSIQQDTSPVVVTTTKGTEYKFDLLIGADGVKSFVRSTLFPDARPYPPTSVAAYRATLPYEHVFTQVPEAREILANRVDTYMCPGSYVIFYPTKGGRELNIVLSHMAKHKVDKVEDVDIEDVREQYKAYPPVVRKIVQLIPRTQRWPLMLMPPMASWSSPAKNVVLMGDAAHAMENHIAQGAGTAIEDGAFLGRALSEVVRGNVTVPEVVSIYEEARMPRAWMKQQAAFVTGCLLLLPDEERIKSRDSVYKPGDDFLPKTSVCPGKDKVTGPDPTRFSWNMFGSPDSIPSVSGYDADADADFAVQKHLAQKRPSDPHTHLVPDLEAMWTGAFFGRESVGRMAGMRH